MMFRQRIGANARRIATDANDVDRFEGITSTYSPYFTTTSPGRTVLNLINANADQDATVTITLHDFDGSVLGTPVTLELPVNHQINKDLVNIFQNDSEILGQEGWIEVESSVDRVVGNVSFGIIGGNILTTLELSISSLGEFVIPLASENSDYGTEIMLLNTTGQSATVQIELWGEDGVQDDSIQLSLPSNASLDGFLTDYFSTEFDRLYGYIRVISTQPLHAYSILWGLDQGIACSMLPIPVPEQ